MLNNITAKYPILWTHNKSDLKYNAEKEDAPRKPFYNFVVPHRHYSRMDQFSIRRAMNAQGCFE